MKIVILCGGQGTRIRDVSEVLPKPMLPIGDRPILWHIMKLYSYYGFNEFILCLGYKGWVIKEFFLNYYTKTSDFSVTLGKPDSISFYSKNSEANWKIAFLDTGQDALTGTRILRVKDYLNQDGMFGVTYGDGLADINLNALINAHKASGLLATITGVQPLGRFGEIEAQGDLIQGFNEKPNVSSGLINGGFMVFDRKAFDKYFDPQVNQSLENDVLPRMVKDRQAGVFRHPGSWQCIDTPREYNTLNQLWNENRPFWKVWE